MPTLEMQLPDMSPKSMTRRARRSGAVVAIEKAGMLGQTLLALRRVQKNLVDSIEKADTEQKASLANAICRVAEQRRVLLRLPGPPTGSSKPIDEMRRAEATVIDVDNRLNEAIAEAKSIDSVDPTASASVDSPINPA